MAQRRRSQGPAKSMASLIIPLSIAGMGAAAYYGYPAMAAIWLGLVVIAWTEPPVVLTGKSRTSAYPVAATPTEARDYQRFRFWNALQWKMLIPNGDWLPGLPVLGAFLAACIGAYAAYYIPVTDPYTAEYGAWINVAAVYISVMQVCGSRRANVVSGDVSPGVRVNSLISLFRKKPKSSTALALAGLALGSVAAVIGGVYLPLVADVPAHALWTVCLAGFPLLMLSKPWADEALGEWREVVAHRELWNARWLSLKVDPSPRLISHTTVGNAVVDTFDAPSGTSAQTYLDMALKIDTAIGAGLKVAVLETPNVTVKGEPIPGTMHPNRFQVITWPSDGMPDLTDPTLPVDVATLAIRSGMAWAMDELSYFRPVFNDLTLVTKVPANIPAPPKQRVKKQIEDEVTGAMVTVTEYVEDESYIEQIQGERTSPAVWATTWHPGTGPGMKNLRLNGSGPLSSKLRTSVAVDHRFNGGEGLVLIGALDDVSTEYSEESGLTEKAVQDLLTEDAWTGRWTEVLKLGANQPTIKLSNYAEAALKDGTLISKQPFVVPKGFSPADFMKLDDKISTAMNSAPFVYVSWLAVPSKGTERSGERHPGAIAVYWSEKKVPTSPQALEPSHGQGPRWLLSGMVGKAFHAAGLDQPEPISIRPLTTLRSEQHIWKVDLRLYGKSTLKTIRASITQIQSTLGAPYIRVAEHAEGCTLVIGAEPQSARIANPADTDYLIGLDWQDAWLSGKIVNAHGMLPTLSRSEVLPNNDKVQVLDFDLPSGLDHTTVRSAKAKLKTSTGNEFLEVMKVDGKPSQARLMVSRTNPLPLSIPFDWECIDKSTGIPFATGIDGSPVIYDPKEDPHLLVVGASGSGKSVLLQSLIYAAFVRGSEVWIADPVKDANDFSFAIPYAKLVTKDYYETAEMMKEIYAEMVRRKTLLGQHGVGNFLDLPDEVRPRRLVAVIDEFTSLIQKDEPYTAKEIGDDPELEAENDAILSLNKAKIQTGKLAAKLIREARAFGITVIIATQKMSADDAAVIGKDLKTNMSRILAGKTTYGDRMSALKDPDSAPDLGDAIPKGRALFESQAVPCAIIQTWFEPGGQRELTAKLQERVSPIDPSEKFASLSSQPKAKKRVQPKVIDLGTVDFGDLDFDLMAAEENGDGVGTADPISSEPVQVFPEAPVFTPESPAAPVVRERPKVALPANFFDLPEEDEEVVFETAVEDMSEEVVTVPELPEPVMAEEPPVVRKAPVQRPRESRRSQPASPAQAPGSGNPFDVFQPRTAAPAEDNPFA